MRACVHIYIYINLHACGSFVHVQISAFVGTQTRWESLRNQCISFIHQRSKRLMLISWDKKTGSWCPPFRHLFIFLSGHLWCTAWALFPGSSSLLSAPYAQTCAPSSSSLVLHRCLLETGAMIKICAKYSCNLIESNYIPCKIKRKFRDSQTEFTWQLCF